MFKLAAASEEGAEVEEEEVDVDAVLGGGGGAAKLLVICQRKKKSPPKIALERYCWSSVGKKKKGKLKSQCPLAKRSRFWGLFLIPVTHLWAAYRGICERMYYIYIYIYIYA